jgi:hypothetical protein
MEQVMRKRLLSYWRSLDHSDILLFMGAGCIVYGIRLIYTPAAWISAGVLLVVFAFLIAKDRVEHASVAKPGQE